MRLRNACLLCLLSLCSATSGSAQVSSTDARRLGLEIAWQAQVQMPKVGRGIVSSHLWVDATGPARKYAVVELTDGRTVRVSADELDWRGEPLGIEGAKTQAGERAARLLGTNEGISVVETSVPQIRLVFITSDGLVQNFDAESGQLLWSAACGSALAPAHPGAVSPVGVSLIHGRNLYLLNWEQGKQVMNLELKYGSSMALAVCNDLAYVSDFGGRLQAYGLGVERKLWSSQIIGRAVGQPVTLANQSLCAIASTAGFVYTLTAGENPGLWTRYETSSAISGSLAAGNNAFYAGTGDGLLTKISVAQRIGSLDWEYPSGETITAPALVLGPRVVVATEGGAVHCIDDQTGFAVWSQAGQRVQQPLATAAGRYLCLTHSGEIYGFDSETGAVVGRTAPSNIRTAVNNQISDRLYLVGIDGRLQCLRARDAVLPNMIAPVVADEQAAPEEAAPPPAKPAPAAPAANPFNFDNAAPAAPTTNPFGSGAADPANPFGAGAAAPADSNPFGGGATPAGDAGGTTDPLGTGEMANPFGGDNPF